MYTICFVEDEQALDETVRRCRDAKEFPDCRAEFFAEASQALEWAKGHVGPVVFVVDSRMYSEDIKASLDEALSAEGMAAKDVLMEVNPEIGEDVLTGVAASILLKRRCPQSRVIVASAYLGKIAQARKANERLDKLVAANVDVILPKVSPDDLLTAIRAQLQVLGWKGEPSA